MTDRFSQIFERDAAWLTGRYIAAEIIRFQKGKAPVVERSTAYPESVTLQVPRPLVKNKVNGEMVSIDLLVPPELQSIYLEQLTDAMQHWVDVDPNDWEAMREYLGTPLTDVTITQMNNVLAAAEARRRAYGRVPEMWMLTAEAFGFNRWNVPDLRLSSE